MELETKEDVETNVSISSLELDRTRTRVYIKQEAEDSKEFLKRALYSPVKCEPSSLKITDCEDLSTSFKDKYCNICNIFFWTRRLYLDHELHSHTTKETPIIDLKTFTCNICNRKYRSFQAYHRHMVQQNNIGTLSLEPKSQQQIKIKPTVDMSDLFCDVCNKKFKSKVFYTRHLVIIHGITMPNIYLESIHPDTESLYCKICNKAYKVKYALASHLKKKHCIVPSSLIPNIYDQNNYCAAWDQTFVKRLNYLRHLAGTHLDTIPELYQGIDCKNLRKDDSRFERYCADCQRVFLTRRLYHIHMDKIHGVKPLKYSPKEDDPDNHCNLCDRRYSEKGTFRSHMLNAHNLIVPKRSSGVNNAIPIVKDVFKKYCNACDRMYVSPKSYYAHIYRYHCINTFTTKAAPTYNNLTKMPAIDKTGTYCASCDKIYKSRASYRAHLNKVHGVLRHRTRQINRDIIPDMDDKNNHCASCDKTYRNRATYWYHLDKVHDMKKPNIKQEDKKESLNIQL